MDHPLAVLFEDQLRRWVSARGFWVVLAVTLVPAILTGAWVFTHDADVAVTEVTLTPAEPTADEMVRFEATVTNVGNVSVGEFNASLIVGTPRVQNGRVVLQPVGPPNKTTISGLDVGESATLDLSWRARPGAYYAAGRANVDNSLKEVESFNNQKVKAFTVPHPEPGPDAGPEDPQDVTGNESATTTADVAVTDLAWTPTNPVRNQTITVEATVENPSNSSVSTTLSLNSFRQRSSRFGNQLVPGPATEREVDLAAGATETVTLQYTTIEGVQWFQAVANVTDEGVHDPDASNNNRSEHLIVQPSEPQEPPEPPESTTIKGFYRTILNLLFLPALMPFVALYYAGGLIADERRDGTLPYLLTRPLPRWLIPTSKFLAGFLVAGAATVVGLVVTYLLLFSVAGSGSITFLTGPVVLSLLSLFVYGSGFTLLAVLAERPYLLGLAFIVGWEEIVGNLVPWVENLTVDFHVANLLDAWWNAEDLVFRATPDWDAGTRPLLVLLGAGIGFLILAGLAMKHKQFPDA